MTRDRLRCGAVGEDLAAAFLVARGLAVVTRNFRCAAGEIDLVARDGRTIVFCEIRTRRTASRGSALESVTPAKQRQVCRVAAYYVARHGLHDRAMRFDVVAVELRDLTVSLQHVVDAFEAV